MTEPTDVQELRERIERHLNVPWDGRDVFGSERLLREAVAELERLDKLEALRIRLQMFLAAVGASTPDDHPWVVEARALANALRTCELATPAPAPQQGGEDD